MCRKIVRCALSNKQADRVSQIMQKTALVDLQHCPQTAHEATGLWRLTQTVALCQQGYGILLTQMLRTLTDRRQERCGVTLGPH